MWTAADWLPLWGVGSLAAITTLALSLLRSVRQLEQIKRRTVPSAVSQHELELARSQTKAAELRLREVIHAVPAGLAVYDNQDRRAVAIRSCRGSTPVPQYPCRD